MFSCVASDVFICTVVVSKLVLHMVVLKHENGRKYYNYNYNKERSQLGSSAKPFGFRICGRNVSNFEAK